MFFVHVYYFLFVFLLPYVNILAHRVNFVKHMLHLRLWCLTIITLADILYYVRRYNDKRNKGGLPCRKVSNVAH